MFTPEPSAKDKGPPEVDEDTAAKIEWLKHNKQPQEQVVAYTKETVKHRQKWIKAHRGQYQQAPSWQSIPT